MNKCYIYGMNNRITYVDDSGPTDSDSNSGKPAERTHYDPRVEVQAIAHTVQIGIVPPTQLSSGPDSVVWDPDDGKFISLDRNGINRLIMALREARDDAFGKDQ